MDFVRNRLAHGGAFRAFTLGDDYTRECPVIEVLCKRGRPLAILCDHGPEFTSRAFDAWAYRQQIQVTFIRPGKAIESAFIERFNGRLRDGCLSVSWFLDLDNARAQIEA